MQDKELLSRMLGIEEPWYICEVNLDLEKKRLEVEVECRKTEWAGEQGRKLWLHGYEERTWRHLDAFQFETVIRARVPRLRYPADEDDDENDEGGGPAVSGRTELLPVPRAEKGGRFTLLFECFAVQVLLAARSVSEAARLLRLSWDQAQHLLKRAVQRGLARRETKQWRRCRLMSRSEAETAGLTCQQKITGKRASGADRAMSAC
jgi:transposase